jgi:hypothetical protein
MTQRLSGPVGIHPQHLDGPSDGHWSLRWTFRAKDIIDPEHVMKMACRTHEAANRQVIDHLPERGEG